MQLKALKAHSSKLQITLLWDLPVKCRTVYNILSKKDYYDIGDEQGQPWPIFKFN